MWRIVYEDVGVSVSGHICMYIYIDLLILYLYMYICIYVYIDLLFIYVYKYITYI